MIGSSSLMYPLRFCLVSFAAVASCLFAASAVAVEALPEAPLAVGNRQVHVFRATLGAFTAAERADAAKQRILRALEEPGEGWTSVKTVDQGVLVELDGKTMFTVAAGDARSAAGETAADMANRSSRVLQKVWQESREQRDARAQWAAVARTAVAAIVLALTLYAIWRIVRAIRRAITARVVRRFTGVPAAEGNHRLSSLFVSSVSRTFLLLAWLLSLLAVFAFLTYSLEQFVLTRAVGEGLLQSFACAAPKISSVRN